MKLTAYFLLIGAFLASVACSEAAGPPNIVVIMADDLGYADLSFLPQSPPDIDTPAIDRLAAEGTYFSNAYATAPICSPSRCGMITGRYQQRWGNYWYGQGGLPNEETTLPQVLNELGYSSHKIGKTHLNGGPAEHPLDHGFQDFLGFMHHTWDYIRLSEKDLAAYQERAGGKSLGILNVGPLEKGKGGRASYEEGFTTEIFTEEAIKRIRAGQESEKPFYIQLEHNAVHMPTYVADPDYAREAGYEQPVWDREAAKWEFPFWDPNEMSWNDWHKKWGHLGEVDSLGRKRYLANLAALDDSVASILAALEETGQRGNTILVFLSDNGGTINTYSNNSPLRGYKYMFGEGGVRIPIIVSWKGQLPEGQTRSVLTSGMDIFPTVVELAGGTLPANLDGKSLVKTIRNPEVDSVHDFLCFSDGKGTWSIRQGDWKLIQSAGWVHSNYELDENNLARSAPDYLYPEGLVLFNLKEDIGETRNLADIHPERVAALKAKYEAWRGEMGAPRRGKTRKK
ncbi:MAG: sulfatase-like hydrolase/transferase [Verrucomicrobiales bacterium]|nr:sulfatase-like hydrolase/transferase [Verrucomicrobiales bacterium]